MVVVNKVEIDKEIREGWTLRDFIDEIDYSVYQIMTYGGFRKPPTNTDEMKILIEDLIPRHIFTTDKQTVPVVEDLTTYYAREYGLVEDDY